MAKQLTNADIVKGLDSFIQMCNDANANGVTLADEYHLQQDAMSRKMNALMPAELIARIKELDKKTPGPYHEAIKRGLLD